MCLVCDEGRSHALVNHFLFLLKHFSKLWEQMRDTRWRYWKKGYSLLCCVVFLWRSHDGCTDHNRFWCECIRGVITWVHLSLLLWCSHWSHHAHMRSQFLSSLSGDVVDFIRPTGVSWMSREMGRLSQSQHSLEVIVLYFRRLNHGFLL